MARAGSGRNEDALSEIVGFVLVLALVVVASTLYLMYVVPAEGREDEIEHMNQVQDRFVSYKTSVDGLWMRSLADLSVPGTRGVSLSTSFDLGTGGGNTQSTGLFLSFMKPIGTAAKMRTQRDTTPATPTTERFSLFIDDTAYFTEPAGENIYEDVPIGSLSYHTDNYYWIQQNYYYKLGGIFLEQPGEGVSVKVAPAIAIYQVKNRSDENRKTAKVSISLVNLTSPDSTVGGTGPLRVETRLRESVAATYRNEPVREIKLSVFKQKADGSPDTEWLDAWRQVFTDAARRSTLRDNPSAPLDVYDGEWFYLPDSLDDPGFNPWYAELRIRNWSAGDDDKDVFLDLSQASLQVTFEYDE